MVDPTTPAESIEERDDLGKNDAAIWAYWTGQEAIAEKEERKWIKRSRDIVKRYRDERPDADNSTHKFNILWANVQTLKPTLYGRTPKPDVERRFKDNATPTARYAAILMQEALSFSVGAFSFDTVMKGLVEDRLLPGRGVARVLYVPHFGEPEEEQDGDEGQDETAPDKVQTKPEGGNQDAAPAKAAGDDDGATKQEPVRPVVYEEAIAKYVFWEDYREGPARQWEEVPWIRYRSYMTRSELTERFGEAKAKLIELDYTPKGAAGSSGKEEPPPDLYKKAIVHEYWDKSKKEAVWLAPGTPDVILDTKDDPLELPDFFPNPDPLLATTTNDKRIPVPDYAEYQDQARELDKLTARIDTLTQALKVAGVYAGDNKQVLQQLFDSSENKLIPVGDLQRWSESGGLKGLVEWLPIDMIAETLIQLYNARDRVKAILYELTGIGDILRGMTQPDETLGAQELKAVFATRRITPQQKDVARFARDLIRLMGGIIAAHFSEKTISMITGYPQLAPVPPLPPRPTPPPMPAPMLGLPAPMPGGGIPPQMPGAPPRPPMNMPPPQSPGAAMPAPGGASPTPMGNGAAPPGMPPHPPLQIGGPPQASGPMAGGSPSMPGQPTAPPPPDPQQVAYQQAEAQWQAMAKQVQAITQANQKKQQEFSQACALIKSDGVHGFKIDIETDSTIAPDEQAEKKARTEFIGAFVPLMEQLIPVAQGNPAIADLAKEIALFGVRGFPVARSLEESIGKAFDAIAQMPPHPSQQGKAPQQKAGDSPAALAVKVQDIQSKERIADTKAQTEREATAAEARGDDLELQATRERDQNKLALEVMDKSHKNAISGARLTHVEGRPEPGPVQ